MNLLLILYAMIAGLTGLNTGPSGAARMAAVAQDQAIGAAVRPIASQAEIAAFALIRRQAASIILPATVPVDARRIAIDSAGPLLVSGRATPERRRE